MCSLTYLFVPPPLTGVHLTVMAHATLGHPDRRIRRVGLEGRIPDELHHAFDGITSPELQLLGKVVPFWPE